MPAPAPVQCVGQLQEKRGIQEPFATSVAAPITARPVPAPNRTGLPDRLKVAIESLSGLDMSDVRVHSNSDKPAQFNALAYAQGTDIHIAPGQDRHLPHEAWHVVQQAQSRVKPTRQLKGGVQINDETGLEHEADVMGTKATRMRGSDVSATDPGTPTALTVQRPAAKRDPSEVNGEAIGLGGAKPHSEFTPSAGAVVQRAVGFEFETGYKIERKQANTWVNLQKMDVVKNYGNDILLTADENSAGFSAIEMVLDPPVQESDRPKFVKALATFEKVGESFEGLKPGRGVNVPVPTLLNKVPGAAKGPSGYRVTPNFSGFRGNPQLTGGFRFDRLFSMMEDATRKTSDLATDDPHKEAKEEMTLHKELSSDTIALAGATSEVSKINGSDELKAMVSLLGMYLNFAAAGVNKPLLNYAKLIANSFMARTDFGKMFYKLPQEEYLRFTRAPQSFVDMVLTAAGMSGTGNTKVFERGVRTSDIKTSPGYKVDLTNDPTSGLDVTRQNWLIKLTLGNDLLSSARMPQHKPRLMGLGALGHRTDRVGDDPVPPKRAYDKGRGIIVELRNMKLDQAPSDFSETALAIFDYIVDLNT